MKYLIYIDGIRALAIIPVVIYHLFPGLCPGGFTGVDVFFVISGFLITKGITTNLTRNRFSISDFYVRRIKRIIPGYFSVIACVLAAFPFVYSLKNYKSICEAGFYSSFYAANIYFSSVVSYFDLNSRSNPLLHLWSLGVEEQFYLVIPLCIWMIWKFANKKLTLSLLVLFSISLFASALSTFRGDLQYAFYMLPSRAWELLSGSIISQVALNGKVLRYKMFLSASGWLLVLGPFFLYSDETLFPGLAAIPSVLGACLLILFGYFGSANKIFSFRPFVQIGKASYSLYLWHWPIFLFLNSSLSIKRAIAGIILTGVATFLSYRFIENPIRNSKAIQRRHAFAMLTVGTFLISMFCLYVLSLKVKIGELPVYWRDVPTYIKAEKERKASRSECSFDDLVAEKASLLIKIGDQKVKPSFVLWGDSHALALLPGMDMIAAEHGKAGFFINLKHSLTMNEKIGAYPFNPRKDREPVISWLEMQKDITDVYLVNNWFASLRGKSDIIEVDYICQRLRKSGKNVFLFNNAPYSAEDAIRRYEWGLSHTVKNDILQFSAYNASASLQTELADRLTSMNIANIVPINDAFIDNDGYAMIQDKACYLLDSNHLSELGAIRAMRFAAPLIWHEK